MRTTVTIDADFCQKALEAADPGMASSDLFREATKVFVRVQAGKRLAAPGGSARKCVPGPFRCLSVAPFGAALTIMTEPVELMSRDGVLNQ